MLTFVLTHAEKNKEKLLQLKHFSFLIKNEAFYFSNCFNIEYC